MKCTRGHPQSLSHVWLFAVPWTGAHQVPLSIGWYRNTGTGCCFFLQGIFLTQGLNPHLVSPTVGRQILYQLSHPGSACTWGNRAKCRCVSKDQEPSLDSFLFCSLDNCWCSVNVSWKQKVRALWEYTEMSLPCYDQSSFLAWAVAIIFLIGFLSPIATSPVPLWPPSAGWTDSATKSCIPLLLSWKPLWHSPPSLKSESLHILPYFQNQASAHFPSSVSCQSSFSSPTTVFHTHRISCLLPSVLCLLTLLSLKLHLCWEVHAGLGPNSNLHALHLLVPLTLEFFTIVFSAYQIPAHPSKSRYQIASSWRLLQISLHSRFSVGTPMGHCGSAVCCCFSFYLSVGTSVQRALIRKGPYLILHFI